MISSLSGCGDLLDRTAVAECLTDAGMSGPWAASKAEMLRQSVMTLRETFPANEVPGLSAFFIPGRIEVLGKHTDYVGGSSLLAAAEQGFVIVCAPRQDGRVSVTDCAMW